ncbi:hypothetical protein BGZ76_002075, partial [Entomortierella beljakovae]
MSGPPTLEDIERQFPQLPPQYRQAVLEKHQREYQQQLQQGGQGQPQQPQPQQQQSQPPQKQQQQQQQPQHRQTSRLEPERNQSVSLSSSPNVPNGGVANSSAWSSSRQRISSAPLSSAYKSGRDTDSLNSNSSATSGPSRAHWKPDSSTNVCTWPGCRLEFNLFDRRHHCRKCGDIFCSTHCSKEVPLDNTLEFNISKGTKGRACIGCYEAYEQWQGITPSGRNQSSSNFARDPCVPTNANTLSNSSTHKLNSGHVPDECLAGETTRESLGREDIVRPSNGGSGNIAIKKQPAPVDQSQMPMPSVPHDWSW